MKYRAIQVIGIILILIGLLFLGVNARLYALTTMWPSLLLLLGFGCLIAHFIIPKSQVLLMPAAVLIISSIPLFICTFSLQWNRLAYLWPLFVLSVAIGFLLMYLRGRREKDYLISAAYLTGFSIIAYLIFHYLRSVFPVIFILLGLVLILTSHLLLKKTKSS